MTTLGKALRRTLLAALLAGFAGAAYAWWRQRSDHPEHHEPPEWPPIVPTPRTESSTDGSAGAATTAASPVDVPAKTTDPTAADAASAEPTPDAAPAPSIEPPARPATADSTTSTATASFVNALVDAPDARSSDGESGGWVEPDDDGNCPLDFPIKANDNSGIFHVPGGRFYDRTRAERCYSNEDTATADGYRRAKN